MKKIVKKVMKFLIRKLYIKNDILILKKKSHQPLESKIKNLNIKLLDKNEVLTLPNRKAQILLSDLQRGNQIYGILIDGKVVHYSCISLNSQKIGEINRIFNIPQNGVYIYNCFTLEEYRGKNLYYNMLSYLDFKFRYLNKFIVVSTKNTISHHVIKKIGFNEIAYFKYRKILNMHKLNEVKMCDEIKDKLEIIK
ncbi:hypothetical protein [Oceanirhabdus seepicola]|uniref:Uncharacterized protein n=1 Tax=Oceanirhabdus seepicola TaxID=2828781 RepID=A0A9J6P3W5_9CLOT|nr:hypothetical protein [Oceanirhabdus seepicola]MCM1990509.1 hypothetical protein [Oceanirhabdus seepicola]